MNKQIIAKELLKIAKELVGQNEDNLRKEFEKLLDWAKRNFDKIEEINDDTFNFQTIYKKNNKIIGLRLHLKIYPQYFSYMTNVHDNRESWQGWSYSRLGNHLKSYDEGIKAIKNSLVESVQQHIETLDVRTEPFKEKLQKNREYIETLQEKNKIYQKKISDVNSQQEEYKKLLNKF